MSLGEPFSGLWRILLACLGLFLGLALSASSEPLPDFNEWLAGLRAEAVASGISVETLDSALVGLAPIPRVLELDRAQPEDTLSLAQYLAIMAGEQRLRKGRDRLAAKRELLAGVEAEYGVPPAILTALWGIESDFGRVTGTFPVLGALATLAHDRRRAAFFRRELLAALTLCDTGVVVLSELRGSWAGAMGQLQFLPSVLLRYGVDADRDGRISIWRAGPDLFASGARYLAASGWQAGQPWGIEVALPGGMPTGELRADVRKPVAVWFHAGLRPIRTPGAQVSTLPATLYLPEGPVGRAFLIMDNFEVLLRWNRSTKYALAVGLLGDQLLDPSMQ